MVFYVNLECKIREKSAIFQFFIVVSRNGDNKTRFFGALNSLIAIFALQNGNAGF